MKKDKEFEITEIDLEEMAHLIHVIPTPNLLRIAIGYEVILRYKRRMVSIWIWSQKTFTHTSNCKTNNKL